MNLILAAVSFILPCSSPDAQVDESQLIERHRLTFESIDRVTGISNEPFFVQQYGNPLRDIKVELDKSGDRYVISSRDSTILVNGGGKRFLTIWGRKSTMILGLSLSPPDLPGNRKLLNLNRCSEIASQLYRQLDGELSFSSNVSAAAENVNEAKVVLEQIDPTSRFPIDAPWEYRIDRLSGVPRLLWISHPPKRRVFIGDPVTEDAIKVNLVQAMEAYSPWGEYDIRIAPPKYHSAALDGYPNQLRAEDNRNVRAGYAQVMYTGSIHDPSSHDAKSKSLSRFVLFWADAETGHVLALAPSWLYTASSPSKGREAPFDWSGKWIVGSASGTITNGDKSSEDLSRKVVLRQGKRVLVASTNEEGSILKVMTPDGTYFGKPSPALARAIRAQPDFQPKFSGKS